MVSDPLVGCDQVETRVLNDGLPLVMAFSRDACGFRRDLGYGVMLAVVVVVGFQAVKHRSVGTAQAAKGLLAVAYRTVQAFHFVIRGMVVAGRAAVGAHALATDTRIALVVRLVIKHLAGRLLVGGRL